MQYSFVMCSKPILSALDRISYAIYIEFDAKLPYSYPWIYVASINVVSIYVVKFFIPCNFILYCNSIYDAFFSEPTAT